MMGGDSGGGGDGGAGAREAQRQAQIRAGLDVVDKAFDGTTRGVNRATAYVPGQIYYNADGSVWSPSTGMQTTQTGGMEAYDATGDGQYSWLRPTTVTTAALPAAEQFGGSELYTGTEKTGGFGDEYFANIAKMHKDHYTPLINEQYQAAQRTLPYKFSNTANSEYQRAAGELERDYQRQLVDESSQAEDFANQRRQQVENQRQALVSQVTAGADPGAAATLAAGAVKSLSAQPTFSALGDLFGRYMTNGVGAYQAGQSNQPISYTPLNFGTRSNAVTVRP